MSSMIKDILKTNVLEEGSAVVAILKNEIE
jgi:hypothetical protein